MSTVTQMKRISFTEKGGKSVGPFSQAVVVDNRMFTAGQLGADPATGKLVAGGLLPEIEQTFRNMAAVLESQGATFDNIIKTTVYLADINDWPRFNDVYKTYFPNGLPARTAFQVGALPLGAQIEMEAVVALGDVKHVQ